MGDVAIVGFSFKLPGGLDTVSDLWDALEKGRNMLEDWPTSRINGNAFHGAEESARNKVHSRGGYFIKDNPGAFDAPFFSVTAAEAASMDPMQRWTLETSFRAFENAGISIESLKRSRTAVFSASMTDDYSRMVSKDPENASRMAITGTFSSIIPNRVSWFFDLAGPSVHVDTACSGSLAALDLACQSLAGGSASMALVTGSNLILGPDGFFLLSSLNFLSPDSKSYSFDHRANGYARGEGVIALVLKPLMDAIRDGDMVRAVIRATSTNQDGRTPSLTQPSPEAQKDLIQQVYKKANLSFDSTRYVEAHGTGTPVGDPIEMKAIGKVFRPYRSSEEPLYVGSVKANIGHLEGCSGLAGIIKAILVLEKGIIVPNALFEHGNENIDFDFYHTEVPTKAIPWPCDGLRRVSVNSFGFGGTNTHVILDDAFHYLQEKGLPGNHCTTHTSTPNSLHFHGQDKAESTHFITINGTNGADRKASSRTNGPNGTNGTNGVPNNGVTTHIDPIPKTNTPHVALLGEQGEVPFGGAKTKLLIWSASDEKSLQRTLQQYESYINAHMTGTRENLDQLAYTLASRRSHMLWRTFAVASEGSLNAMRRISTLKLVRSTSQVGVALVFTGQGAQYVKMGLGLMQYPIYEMTLKKIDTLYRDLGCKWSIFDQIQCFENIDKPEYSQPLSTALQIALVHLLGSFGISPKVVVGHSSGEIAAAYTVGALTMASACKVSYLRGQLAGKLKTKTNSAGSMISVNVPHDQVKDHLKAVGYPAIEQLVNVACINSPINCTLSGPEDAIDATKQHLDNEGIFAQKLKTGVAYHSSFMSIIANDYLLQMGTLEASHIRSTIPMISTVTGRPIKSQVLSTGQYWVDNLVSPVRFSDAIRILTQEPSTLKVGIGNITDLVEMGPHAALKRPIRDTVDQAGNRKQTRYACSLNRSRDAVESVLELLGHLFCHGYKFSIGDANQLLRHPTPRFLVDCPEYPFDRSHTYWTESRLSRDFRLRECTSGSFLGWRFHDWNPLEPRWRNLWSVEMTPWVGDHVVSNTTIYPAAGMLIMAMEAVREMAMKNRAVSGYYIKEAHFLIPIIIKDTWENKTETILRLRPLQKSYEKQASWSDISLFAVYNDRWNECFKATIQIQYEEQSTEVDNGIEKRLERDRIAAQYRGAIGRCTKNINSQHFYRNSEENGIKYGEWFRLLEGIRWDGSGTSIARASMTGKHQTTIIHPAVLDAAFQVLRVSLTKGLSASSGTHVPMSLHDGWFSATGWQTSHTASIRYMTIASTSTGGIAKEGAIYALADDDSVLCHMRRLVTGQVSKEDKAVQPPHRKLLYGIDWQPQFSLMRPEQLRRSFGDTSFSKDEGDMVSWHSKLTNALNVSLCKTLRQLTPDDRRRIPTSLSRHVRWMEHQAQKIPPSQANPEITDDHLEILLREIEALNPPWKLFTSVVRHLKQILAGEIDPLSVIFESNLAEVFYADMFKSICDSRLERIMTLLSHETPQLRILEVGAGTGGMTTHILSPLLSLEGGGRKTTGLRFAEYTYTDVSRTFFEGAKARWHNHHPHHDEEDGRRTMMRMRMSFATLDLERPVEDQVGIEPGSYDLVVAGSVLHATRDLGAALRNVRRTLKKGGRMILLEPVAPENVITNFAFGLVPGWWNCEEEDRAMSPAVGEETWHECLLANGFSGNDLCLRDFESEVCHIFSLIVTTAEDEPCPDELVVAAKRKCFLVVDSASESQYALAASLEATLMLLSPNRQVITVTLVQFEEADVTDSDIVIALLEADRPFLASLTQEEFQAFQLLVKTSRNLLWVTVMRSDDTRYALYGVAAGFFRSMRTEATDQHLVTLSIELEDGNCADILSYVVTVLGAAFENSSPEVEYVVRRGEIITGRVFEESSLNQDVYSRLHPQLKHDAWASGSSLQLTVRTPGDLESLEFVDDPVYTTPLGPREIEIEAKAWGVNARDVYVALGRLEDGDLGGDCAGIVTRMGSDCDSKIQVGDRVCMLSPGCMRAHPRAPETGVLKVPTDLSFEAAASIVAPGITAYYSLIDVARLRAGEKILIHSAAGSTGQAALWIAKLRGAEIFATVGFDEKKDFLIETFGVPADHIFYSRNTSFQQGVMRMTGGRGVDVVLNSLSGDGLRASWECVAPYGRFIEIGKADIVANSSLPMACFAKNVTFSAVDLLHLSQSNQALTARLLEDTLGLLDQGARPPTPLHVYPVSRVEEAFRFLQGGRNTGRIVIGIDSAEIVPQRVLKKASWEFDSQASYVIAGGFGGLGRAISSRMADRGAKHLIILSRSGPASKAATDLVQSLTARGVTVFSPKCNVSMADSLEAVLKECAARSMPPIKGCINAAMVLQDAVFENMSYTQWTTTINSKAQSSWNLHNMLPRDLDFFVLLSSLAGICGTVAQSNYAGGCSAQDALARYRTAHGQKAISFDVGWMRNIGIIAEKESYQRNRRQAADMRQIDDAELFALLDIYCAPALPVMMTTMSVVAKSQLLIGLLTPADFLLQGQTPPQMHDRPLFGSFSHIVSQGVSETSVLVVESPGTLFRLAKDNDERIQIVIKALATKLARAMSILPNDVEPSKPLSSYGVDSLMAVELRNYIGREFQATVAVFDIMGGVPISSIGDLVVEKSVVGKE